MLSATAAVVLRHTLFPYMSINNDEVIYLLHAQTLADGRLFPPAPDPAGSYAPWLAAYEDGHYVLKYTPFIPALYAVSLVLTGGISPVLALVAAAAVVVTYLTGVELFGDRRVGALAATLLACSPLMIIQSALVLSYLPVLVLVQLVILGLLRGLRGGRRRAMAGAGFALGTAAAIRPYDIVLLLVPMAVWGVLAARGRLRWALGWLAAGLVAPVTALLVTNALATGNPLRLPFALLEPDDRLGFGVRRLYPTDGDHDFGLVQGLSAMGDHLWLLGGWACGGVLLAVAAVVSAVRRRLPGPGYALGAGTLLFLVGYIGFWGAWNAAELWGGIRYVGPFYLVPVMIGLVHLGARGLADLATWSRRRLARAATGLTAAAAAGLTVFILVPAVQANATMTGNDRDLTAMLQGLPGRSLVLVTTSPPYLGHPSAVTANPPGLDGEVLFAVSRGVDDLRVLADHPDRTPYLLRMAAGYNRSPNSPSTARVEEVTVVTGREVTIDVRTDTPPRGARTARLVFDAGTRRLTYPVALDGPATARLAVNADGLDPSDITDVVSGTPDDPDGERRAAKPEAASIRGAGTSITVSLQVTYSDGGRWRTVDRQVLPVRIENADRPGAEDGKAAGAGSGDRRAVGDGEADVEEEAEERSGRADGRDGDSGEVTVLAPVRQVAAVGEGVRPAVRLSLAQDD